MFGIIADKRAMHIHHENSEMSQT